MAKSAIMTKDGILSSTGFRMNNADVETITVNMSLWLDSNTVSSVSVETSGCTVVSGVTSTEVTLQTSNVSGRAIIDFTVTDSASNKIKRSFFVYELNDELPGKNSSWYYC